MSTVPAPSHADQVTPFFRRSAHALPMFTWIFLIFGALGVLWAIATPLMAYPDEPSHTIRAAAVVRGQITIQPNQAFGNGVHVQVPSYIANLEAQKCYAFVTYRTADCAPPIPTEDNFDAVAVTSAGSYNPMYYWVVGLPTLLLTGAPAIYMMRIVSALLCALLYAAGFVSLSRLRKPKWPIVAATVGITPMVLFLSSGINPNAIEIAATFAAFAALLSVFDRPKALVSMWPAIAVVGVSTAVLANTRSVSLVWLLCAVITACLFFRWKEIKTVLGNRFVFMSVAFATAGVVLGAIWMWVSMRAPVSSAPAPEGIINPAPGVAPYQAVVTMLDRTFDFITQYIGVMGWLDTPVPQAALSFWSMIFIGIILTSLTARPRRLLVGLLFSLMALAIVPALLQGALVTTVGFFWQGRYSMPLVLVALVSAGMAWRIHAFPAGRRTIGLWRVFLAALVFAHVLSFMYVLRRYVVGLRDISTWQTMISHPSWQPPLGWFLLTILYGTVMAYAAHKIFKYLFPTEKLINMPTLKAPFTKSLRNSGSQDLLVEPNAVLPKKGRTTSVAS